MTFSIKKCPRCGEQIPGPALICSKCGAPQEENWNVVEYDSGPEILEGVNQVCQQLNMTNQLKKVDFLDYLQGPHGAKYPVPSDIPIIEKKKIILPSRLASSVSPEQWAALIASVLILRSLARPGHRRNLSIVGLVTLGFYAPIAWLTIQLWGDRLIALQPLIAIFVFLGALILVGLLLHPGLRVEVFTADKQGADLVGGNTLLDALLKLEALGEDHSGTKARMAKYRYPSIRERIENLKSPQY